MLRRVIFIFLLALFSIPSPSFSQSVGDAPDASRTNFPICSRNWKSIADPEPFPSGETHTGWSFSYNSKHRCFTFQATNFLTGQGAIATNLPLTQNTWTPLDGPVNAQGFRPNLAQYVPAGTYDLQVKVTFATSVANSQYEIAVTQGLSLQTSGLQKNIAIGTDPVGTGNNIFLGAGYCASPGTASNPFECSVIVPKFQCPVARGQACEIRTWAWTSNATSAGAALAASPHTGANYVSTLILRRDRGIEGQQ